MIEANSNWNYSHGLLFSWAIPYHHFGLRTTTPVTKVWTVGVQVVNAWNTVWGNNDMKNIGITSTLTEPKYMWAVNYYEGPNNPGTTSRQAEPAGFELHADAQQQSELLHQPRLRAEQ